MATDEDRVKEIKRRFTAKGLLLRVGKQEDGSWLAVYTGRGRPESTTGLPPGTWVPGLTGKTKLEAVEKAWAYYEGQRAR